MTKILVVDDEQEILNATVGIIKKRGYEVDSALNGLEGLKKVSENRPDLILTDVLMPIMDGYKFYKELKSNSTTANIPVLIVTGRGQMEDSFHVAGVDGFITKPFRPQDLFLEIEYILSISLNRATLEGETGHSRKILALSAEKAVLESMAEQAKRAGYSFAETTASNILISEIMKASPDILFIDIGIKDMDPINLIEILKRLPQLEGKPIVAFFYISREEISFNEIDKKRLGEKIVEAGASKFIGEYNHRIFLKTTFELLGILQQKLRAEE